MAKRDPGGLEFSTYKKYLDWCKGYDKFQYSTSSSTSVAYRNKQLAAIGSTLLDTNLKYSTITRHCQLRGDMKRTKHRSYNQLCPAQHTVKAVGDVLIMQPEGEWTHSHKDTKRQLKNMKLQEKQMLLQDQLVKEQAERQAQEQVEREREVVRQKERERQERKAARRAAREEEELRAEKAAKKAAKKAKKERKRIEAAEKENDEKDALKMDEEKNEKSEENKTKEKLVEETDEEKEKMSTTVLEDESGEIGGENGA